MINLIFFACVGCFHDPKEKNSFVQDTPINKISWSCDYEEDFGWSYLEINKYDCNMTESSITVELVDDTLHFHMQKEQGCTLPITLLIPNADCSRINSLTMSSLGGK